MRFVVMVGLMLTTCACATEKPAIPAPGAFERVAARLNPAQSLLGVGLSLKDKVEIESNRNPVDRDDSLVVAERVGDLDVQRHREAEVAAAAGQAPNAAAVHAEKEARKRLTSPGPIFQSTRTVSTTPVD